jgi:molybdate transport system regulatory protein
MNRLPGRIVKVDAVGSIALVEVEVDTRRYTATLVGAGEEVAAWPSGMPVTLMFKETEVALAKNLSGLISLRNRIPARVVTVERGRLLTRIALDAGGHVIESVITTRSSHLLELAAGDTVEALVKANEMSVMPEPRS